MHASVVTLLKIHVSLIQIHYCSAIYYKFVSCFYAHIQSPLTHTQSISQQPSTHRHHHDQHLATSSLGQARSCAYLRDALVQEELSERCLGGEVDTRAGEHHVGRSHHLGEMGGKGVRRLCVLLPICS